MSSSGHDVRIWAIIPAAGAGRRMGRAKQALPYRGSTLAGTVTQTLLEAGADGVVVVTRTPLVDSLELPDDRRVKVAVNDDKASEMIDSIRIGLASLVRTPSVPHPLRGGGCPWKGWGTEPSPTDGVIVIPADMPALPVDACRRCVTEYTAGTRRIVIATHSGCRGHPILFPFSMRGVIEQLEGGLNELSRQYPERVHLVEIDDPGVTGDVDTAADYDDLAS